jgi:hypothetical protein
VDWSIEGKKILGYLRYVTTVTMHVLGYTWHRLVVGVIILVIMLECIWSRPVVMGIVATEA